MLNQALEKTIPAILLAAAILLPMGQSTVADDGLPSTQQQQLDKFGIEKIYQTKQGGNEWYVNMNDPASDPMFRNLEEMRKQSDGSWQVDGGRNGQVRLEAWSPANEKWQDVEITMYAKMVSGSNELLQLYSRGGHHTSRDECLGSAYKARLYGNGEAAWVKEVNHPAYARNRGLVDVTDDSLKGRWIGFKAVIYNFVENGKTYVRMESYIDDQVTDSSGNLKIGNNWKLASVVEDRGGWRTSESDFDSSCKPLNKDSTNQYRQRDEILNMPGGTSTQNIAAFRSDDLTWNWKYLSVREIDPKAVPVQEQPEQVQEKPVDEPTITEEPIPEEQTNLCGDTSDSCTMIASQQIDASGFATLESVSLELKRTGSPAASSIMVAVVQKDSILASRTIDVGNIGTSSTYVTTTFKPAVNVGEQSFNVLVLSEEDGGIEGTISGWRIGRLY